MKVIVDTSVWIDHFRNNNSRLISLLANGEVLIHPFIIGELSCGNFRARSKIFYYLNNLPISRTVSHEEALFFLERRKLYGKGLGWIDIHILASCLLERVELFTLDKKLDQIAGEIL